MTAFEYDAEIRDQAVYNVDRRHGYTMEFAPSPAAHRDEYDAEEERLHILASTPAPESAHQEVSGDGD